MFWPSDKKTKNRNKTIFEEQTSNQSTSATIIEFHSWKIEKCFAF